MGNGKKSGVEEAKQNSGDRRGKMEENGDATEEERQANVDWTD